MLPFLSFLGSFQPRNNLFCPGFNFYLSYLNILYIFTIFRDFSKISLSSFTLYPSPKNS